MTEEEAIECALNALAAQGTAVGQRSISTLKKDRLARKGKAKSGWLITIPLDVPETFEPNSIDVEVYEDGEVNIPFLL